MNGNSISVQVSDTGGVTLNDVATVIKADIDLGEGTVHVIDKVLTPQQQYQYQLLQPRLHQRKRLQR